MAILPFNEVCVATVNVTLIPYSPQVLYAAQPPLDTTTFVFTRGVIRNVVSNGQVEVIIASNGNINGALSLNNGQFNILPSEWPVPLTAGPANLTVYSGNNSGTATIDVFGYWL